MDRLREFSFDLILLFFFLGILVPYAAGAEPNQKRSAGPASGNLFASVACSPDQPTVPLNGNVHIRVWVNPAADGTLEPTWTVTAGVVQGHGKDVLWDLTGVIHEGIYRAQAKISDDATCSLRVVVVDPTRRGKLTHETGRSFLPKEKKESEGFGLYSYCLLGSRPTAASRERYLRVLSAYSSMIEQVSNLEEYLSPDKLNVTYLPVDVAPPANASASWLLDHYDYVRSRVLLDLLPGGRREGIYLISSLKPLSKDSIPPYLYQDLSTVPTSPEDLISWWVREFLNQAAQEKFWKPQTGEVFVLKLRTTISVLAAGLPGVQQSLKSWISWTK